MKTAFFYEQGSDNKLTSFASQTLTDLFPANEDTTLYPITKGMVIPCQGCFKCWIATPGECVVSKDFLTKTNTAFVTSDLLVIISPIHYGQYSSTIKSVIDHVIVNVLPFFRIHKGTIHHQPRYKKIASQVIIGYSDDLTSEEEATFKELVKANATNTNIPDPPVYICHNEEEIQAALLELKQIMGKGK